MIRKGPRSSLFGIDRGKHGNVLWGKRTRARWERSAGMSAASRHPVVDEKY